MENITFNMDNFMNFSQKHGENDANVTMPPEVLDSWSQYGSFISGILIIIVSTIGILFNIVSAAVFANRRMRSSINVLLAGLSISDAILCVIGGPMFASLGIFTMHPARYLQLIISVSTVTIYPLALMAQTMSVCVLVVITLERYIAVQFPLRAQFICTNSKALLALIACLMTVTGQFDYCWIHLIYS